MGISADALRQLHDAVSVSSESREYIGEATVSAVGVETLVMLDGASSATPAASSTCEVLQGDRVTVRIADGACRITGNLSRAATSQQAVNMTVAPVRTVAAKAKEDAKYASKTAGIANNAAHIAQDAAHSVAGNVIDLEPSIFGGETVDDGGNVTEEPGAIKGVMDAIDRVSADLGVSRESLQEAIDAAREQISETEKGLSQKVDDKAADLTIKLNASAKGMLDEAVAEINGDIAKLSESLSVIGKWSEYGDDGVTLGKVGDTGTVNVMKLKSDQLGFYVRRNGADDAQPVAAIVAGESPSESLLAIGNAEIGQSLRFGRFRWVSRANGNMSLMWAGD